MTQKCQEKSLALNLDIASEKHSVFSLSVFSFFVNLIDNTEKHNLLLKQHRPPAPADGT